MVRFKSRYILFKIHYPSLPIAPILPSREQLIPTKVEIASAPHYYGDGLLLPGGALANADTQTRAQVFYRPGPDSINSSSVNAAIRDSINRCFGDLGAGLVRSSVSCMFACFLLVKEL